MPALLIECGFLSNVAEGQRIATSLFRQEVGTAIAQGIQNYDAAINYRATSPQTFASAKTTLPLHSHSIGEPLANYVPPQATQHDTPSLSITGGN